MSLDNLLEKGKKAVAIGTTTCLLGLSSGCATNDRFLVTPNVDLNNKSVGFIISAYEASKTNIDSSNYSTSSKEWTTGEKVMLGVGILATGVLIYNATKKKETPTPAASTSTPTCPPGMVYDSASGNCF